MRHCGPWEYAIQRADFRRRKYNAIVQSGIPILKRYDIPGELRDTSNGMSDLTKPWIPLFPVDNGVLHVIDSTLGAFSSSS